MLVWLGGSAEANDASHRAGGTFGNGRMLRDSAIAALVEDVALLVSRLSRDASFLTQVERLEPPQSQWQAGLNTLDRLAFEHRFNQTAQPHLLSIAQQPMVARLTRASRPSPIGMP